MISTRLASQNDILASLTQDEKFLFEGKTDEYYFVAQTSFQYIVWNDTKKKAEKITTGSYEVAELKIKRI